ncbi:MAG: hypothetical protein ACOX54_08360 [Christensenellales bacterium]|jgi:hypothetical protein|nr:hypothetical protein [Christensenellaceae bacterium]
MKRLLVVVLVFALLFSLTASAMAEAKMTVTNKNLITFEGNSKAYFFAKVENTGDSAGYVDYGGKLVGFNANDEIIFAEDYVSSYPSNLKLEPGEYAYISDFILDEVLKSDTVTDYKFSIKTIEYGNDYSKIPCEAKLELSADEYDNYVNVTFTNDSDSILYRFTIIIAIYDQNEELVFVDDDYTSAIGIHPGSTITIKANMDSDLIKYYAQNEITLSTVEALIYIED